MIKTKNVEWVCLTILLEWVCLTQDEIKVPFKHSCQDYLKEQNKQNLHPQMEDGGIQMLGCVSLCLCLGHRVYEKNTVYAL